MTQAEERAAVVAWLRGFNWLLFREYAGWKPWRWIFVFHHMRWMRECNHIANAIERGDHIKGANNAT